MTMIAHELFGRIPRPPKFVIFSSYGNDSVALIQHAANCGLTDVVVVFSDTGWAAKFWTERVQHLEYWVHSLGFWTDRTTSIGFRQLAVEKQAFPTQRYQWCSYVLKIEPARRWLDENDPEKRAVCLVGVRRAESADRSTWPIYHLASVNHGGRVMIAPMAEWSDEERDGVLRQAGVEPLPHRSMECSPCVNSNKDDLKSISDEDVDRAEEVEQYLNARFGLTSKGRPRTLFRPHRHMGAVGVREVVRWANSERGKFKPDSDAFVMPDPLEATLDEIEANDPAACDAAFCGN